MNDLEKYFHSNNDRLINKWHHYFDIYDRYFNKYRGTNVVFLEIGIFQGGSLQMWKNYFGPKARIIGIDINPDCKQFEEDQIEIYIGSQSDPNFLEQLKNKIPAVDILLDDGGHTMNQQIVSFNHLYQHIKSDGIYMCEDTHTSYWPGFGGGLRRRSSYIEFAKNWIDDLHAFHYRKNHSKVNALTKTAKSIHFYDSIVVIEKSLIQKPKSSMTGVPSLPMPVDEKSALNSLLLKVKSLWAIINRKF